MAVAQWAWLQCSGEAARGRKRQASAQVGRGRADRSARREREAADHPGHVRDSDADTTADRASLHLPAFEAH
jgi:hypothetical protein